MAEVQLIVPVRYCSECGSSFESRYQQAKTCSGPCGRRRARRKTNERNVRLAADKPRKERQPPKPVNKREEHLRRRYKLSLAAYDAMVDATGGRCPICGQVPNQWVVDHDHACCPGKDTCGQCVRGLLCNPCNRVLWHWLTPESLRAAAAYLEP